MKVERITPAHAGKTFSSKYASKARQDHPRACGENGRRGKHRAGQVGSPPRMRGKPLLGEIACGEPRITPAHAGKTKARNQ